MKAILPYLPYLTNLVWIFCIIQVYHIKEERIKFLQEQIKHEQNKSKIWNADEINGIIELKKTLLEESFRKQLQENEEMFKTYLNGTKKTNEKLIGLINDLDKLK